MSNTKQGTDLAKAQIEEIAGKLKYCSRQYGFTSVVVEKVKGCLLEALSDKDVPQLTKSEFNGLVERLTVNKDESSRASKQHYDCLNSFIFVLREAGNIDSPFYQSPMQLHRNVIAIPNDEVLEKAHYMNVLCRDLLQPMPGPECDTKSLEIDLLCKLVTSAAVHSMVLCPGFFKELLNLRIEQVSDAPVPHGVIIRLPGMKSYYRYVFTFSTAFYLYQSMSFYRQNAGLLGIKRPQLKNDMAITPVMFDLKEFPSLYRKWSEDRLRQNGIECPGGLDVRNLPSYVRMASTMNLLNIPDIVQSYPPYLLAIQSRMVMSTSFSKAFLEPTIWSELPARSHSDYEDHIQRQEIPEELFRLKAVMDEIKDVRRPLLVVTPCGPRARQDVANKIFAIVNAAQANLPAGDHANCLLYAQWIEYMLLQRRGKLKPKTINDYASRCTSLVYELARYGSILTLPPGVLDRIISRILGRYTVKQIRTAIKDFTDYIKVLHDDFVGPDWKRHDLQKYDNIPKKPFVNYIDVIEALDNCYDVFSEHAYRYTKNIAYQEKMHERARYKARIIRIMIQMSFYLGMRIGEIVNLKIENIVFSDGMTVCVRWSKSQNGIRDIPLEKLSPRGFIMEFMEHYCRRKSEGAVPGSFLFINNEPLRPRKTDPGTEGLGSKWDTSHVSSEVTRVFKAIGLSGIRFHELRHAFSNLLILRMYCSFSRKEMPENAPVMQNELFQKDRLDELRLYLLGHDDKRKGRDQFVYVVETLSQAIGHGNTDVTLERYLHVGDVIFFMLANSTMPQTYSYFTTDLQKQLFRSYRSLKGLSQKAGRKTISTKEVLDFLRDLALQPFRETGK